MTKPRFWGWLPTDVSHSVRVAGWVNLAVNIAIVVTGGAVRLTASGLGCPTWPTCTAESLVNTPEMGIHGIIEFANRVLTFVLVVVALATFVLVIRLLRSRPPLFWLALIVGLGIPVQAVIGGISVLVQLNPYVVGLHFVVSAAIVALCSIFVSLMYARTAEGPSPRYLWVSLAFLIVFQSITIVLGILTTGSGPHAGDADAPRNGLNSEFLQHAHSIPAYVALGLTVLTLLLARLAHRRRLMFLAIWLLVANGLQVIVGITQSRLGLPPLLVGTHMFLACVVVALIAGAASTLRSSRESRVSPQN